MQHGKSYCGIRPVFDIKWIRENPEAFDKGLAARGLEPISEKIVAMDEARRQHLTKLQDAQSRRNSASKEIGKAKAAKDEAGAKALMDEVAELKSFIQDGEQTEREMNAALETELAAIPNLPLDEVPVGADENDNKLIRTVGDVPTFDFEVKEHFEIGEALGLMDFETAAKISGARFVVLKGALARLERALAQFMWIFTPPSSVTPRSCRRCWSAIRRRTAPPTCRSSPRISSIPMTASG